MENDTYHYEVWQDGRWKLSAVGLSLKKAAEALYRADRFESPRPRRITDKSGKLIFSVHCSRDTPVSDIRPFWIVMSLDKPGPVERGEGDYMRHATKAQAVAEARRLSAACGGRFGVLELVHLIGWVDFSLKDEIPF